MDDRVRVVQITSVANPGGSFRFQVELETANGTFFVTVAARELLDFDSFQVAALEQTGQLVIAPCGPGAEGPDHYRRHRRAWCNELQSARWTRPMQLTPQPHFGPPALSSSPAAKSSNATPNGVPRPKSRELRGESSYRHD